MPNTSQTRPVNGRPAALARVVGLLGCALLSSCTRFGFDERHTPARDSTAGSEDPIQRPSDGPPPEAPPADNGVDRSPEPPDGRSLSCDWTGSFGFSEPEELTELNTSRSEGEPAVSPDGLSIVFSSARRGGLGGTDLFRANTPNPHGTFAVPVALTALNTPYSDDQLVVAPDGLTAYLVTDRPGGSGASDIWVGTRASTGDPFASELFAPLSGVLTAWNEWDPFPSADGLRLYFCRANEVFGESRIYLATRPSTQQAFSAGQPLSDIADAANQANPVLTADERVIVFNSERPGGVGAFDIWYSVRATPTAPFSSPKLVPNVNSAAYEGELYLSPDGCVLYFASDRPGTGGSNDLYRARYLNR